MVVSAQPLPNPKPDQEWAYLRNPPPQDLIADFQAKAAQRTRLDVSALRPLPVIALRDSVWRTWSAGEEWWRGFSQRHEGATDLVVLSRVGFLPDRSRALVQVIRNCLCSDSGGPLLLMRAPVASGPWSV